MRLVAHPRCQGMEQRSEQTAHCLDRRISSLWCPGWNGVTLLTRGRGEERLWSAGAQRCRAQVVGLQGYRAAGCRDAGCRTPGCRTTGCRIQGLSGPGQQGMKLVGQGGCVGCRRAASKPELAAQGGEAGKGAPLLLPAGRALQLSQEGFEYTQTLWSLPCKSWQDPASS